MGQKGSFWPPGGQKWVIFWVPKKSGFLQKPMKIPTDFEKKGPKMGQKMGQKWVKKGQKWVKNWDRKSVV